MVNITKYASIVFDCDGVVLDSNHIKTRAFRTAAMPYGAAAAASLVGYHVRNGGVSRYTKFQYFLDHIVPEHSLNPSGPDLDKLLSSYAENVRGGLLSCQIAAGLEVLRQLTRHASWLIVSGGDQLELREIFATRRLGHLFDGGIFGSPDTKDEILKRETKYKTIRYPAVFLGDSRLDHKAATRAGLDFIFVHGWTEVQDWQDFVAEIGCPSVHNISQLLSCY